MRSIFCILWEEGCNMHGFTTKAVHSPFVKKDAHGSLHMPVYDSVSFEFDSAEEQEEAFLGKKQRHVYTRITNPTVEHLEQKVKHITGAFSVLAVASGMAAISSTIMAVAQRGDNIITTKLIDGNTRAIFFETITNPQLEVVNIKELSALAVKSGILMIADTTVTPLDFFDSRAFGVDIEVLSATKYISGGATTIGGLIIDNGTFDWAKIPKLKENAKLYGQFAFIAKLRNKLKLIRRATNINDNKTLAIHPSSTIFCEYKEDLKREMRVYDNMIRLSVGIEDVEDIINDIEQALEV